MHELGQALMLMASRVPVFQFNWLSGAGLDRADADAIPAAVARFRDAGQRKFFVQIPPSPHAGRLEAQARAAGLAPHQPPGPSSSARRATRRASKPSFRSARSAATSATCCRDRGRRLRPAGADR